MAQSEIRIIPYNVNLPKHAFGLGQDVSQDITKVFWIPSLFISTSTIRKRLYNSLRNNSTLEQQIQEWLKPNSNGKVELSSKELYGKRTLGNADSIVQATYKGQGHRKAIVDWAANNYVSMAFSLGLIDVNYRTSNFSVTPLGKKAVYHYDHDDLNTTQGKKDMNNFVRQLLYSYPYTAWILRFAQKWAKKHTRGFNKFDSAKGFGFIEDGFNSANQNLYCQWINQASHNNDSKAITKIKSNYESTGDKYMRWLAGVLAKYGLLTSSTGYVVAYKYNKNGVPLTTKAGKRKTIHAPKAYTLSLLGSKALHIVNGGSSYSHQPKYVRWEFLGPKDSEIVKTRRALILRAINNNKPISLDQIEKKVESDCHSYCPKLTINKAEINDDLKGLNRIGIKINHISGNVWQKVDPIYSFNIPIKQDKSLAPDKAQQQIDWIYPKLKKVDHKYIDGIRIAYTGNNKLSDATRLEEISVDLFTKDGLDYRGGHLGATERPDGWATDGKVAWIIDAKAYHNGYNMQEDNTDHMGRYLEELDNKDPNLPSRIKNWYKPIENTKHDNQYFVYVSSEFNGEYKDGYKVLASNTKHQGGMLPICKLLCLAEKYKEHNLDHSEAKKYILDNKVNFKQYKHLLEN